MSGLGFGFGWLAVGTVQQSSRGDTARPGSVEANLGPRVRSIWRLGTAAILLPSVLTCAARPRQAVRYHGCYRRPRPSQAMRCVARALGSCTDWAKGAGRVPLHGHRSRSKSPPFHFCCPPGAWRRAWLFYSRKIRTYEANLLLGAGEDDGRYTSWEILRC